MGSSGKSPGDVACVAGIKRGRGRENLVAQERVGRVVSRYGDEVGDTVLMNRFWKDGEV